MKPRFIKAKMLGRQILRIEIGVSTSSQTLIGTVFPALISMIRSPYRIRQIVSSLKTYASEGCWRSLDLL